MKANPELVAVELERRAIEQAFLCDCVPDFDHPSARSVLTWIGLVLEQVDLMEALDGLPTLVLQRVGESHRYTIFLEPDRYVPGGLFEAERQLGLLPRTIGLATQSDRAEIAEWLTLELLKGPRRPNGLRLSAKQTMPDVHWRWVVEMAEKLEFERTDGLWGLPEDHPLQALDDGP